MLLGRRVSFSGTVLSGLEVPSRWGGKVALEVLGLVCSEELVANPSLFSSVDSILMIFLEQSSWEYFLFTGQTV